ncbi:MAG: hypothetical protein J5894_02855, partial [Clostridia bacterium]|nr:hypothetical protein [Clostridia bacterium]
MKRTDEFNNYKVLNSDGTEHFDETFISTAETGSNAPENYASKVKEVQRFDEIPDSRELSDEFFGGYGELNFSESDAASSGVTDAASGSTAAQTAAQTASAGTATAASGSVLSGIAASLTSVVAAIVVAAAILIPSLKVSQIFAGPFSMIFSVEFSSELREEGQQDVFWYAVLEGEDDFHQSRELWEKTSYLEFYDLQPDTPYTLKIYRGSESDDGWKE